MLLLDRIQDPGNLGIVIQQMRGYRYDCNGKGTADAYQDKVMRASQGSISYSYCHDRIK